MKYLKMTVWIFIGFAICRLLCWILPLQQYGLITEITSPNGVYVAKYSWEKPSLTYDFYIEIYRKKDKKHIFKYCIHSLDYLDALPSDIKWVGDMIKIKGSDFYSDMENSLLWIEKRPEKTILHFSDGFATLPIKK